MKKTLLVLVLAFAAVVSASAQEAGKIWVGGTAGIGYTKVKDGNSRSGFNFQILPEIGYVLGDNVSAGISFGYGQNKFDKEINAAVDTKTFKIKPFIRYTFVKFDRVSIFADGGLGYEWTKFASNGPERNTFDIGIHPGFALHLSENVKFITKVGFLGYTYSKKRSEKTHDLGLNLDMENVLFGVNVYF